jgi:hypothetical protein
LCSGEKQFHPTQNSKRFYREEEKNEKKQAERDTRTGTFLSLENKRTIQSDGEF